MLANYLFILLVCLYGEGTPEKETFMAKEIKREAVINLLEKRGYHAIPNDVVKNGVHLDGISIRTERDIAPCFYLCDFVKRFDTIEDIVEQIINLYESNKSVAFDISLFSSKEWILKNLYIAVQKASDEPLIKRNTDFEDIEQYLYIRGDDNWSVKLNDGLLSNANISTDAAWEAGEKNTFASGQTIIKSMTEVLCEMMGCDDLMDIGYDIPMYVITNPSKVKGGSQIMDKSAILSFFSSIIPSPKRLVLIPSSIHEWIIVPTSDEVIDLETFAEMINEVNAAEVDPTEQLGTRAYVIDL